MGRTHPTDNAAALVLVLQHGRRHLKVISEHMWGRFTVVGATTLRGARKIVRLRSGLAGAILDTALEDGSGFDLIDELRDRDPNLPLLFVTARVDQESVSRAHLVGVPLVSRDRCVANLRHFSHQVATQLACASGNLDQVLARISHTRRLSAREEQLLRVAAHGIPRAHLARRLGISENTIKSQIRSLLDKTKQRSLSEVIWLVHSQAEKC